MSASTIEHTAPDQPKTAQRAGSIDLTRTIGGVDAPAAGRWEIRVGQRLSLETRGLRARELNARVSSGTLLVTDDLLGSSFDFAMVVPDASCCVGFSTRVTRLPSVDVWQADGTTTTTDSRPVSVLLRYNGVFRQRGRPPCLWLTIQTTIDLPELGVMVGTRRGGRLKIAAELNLIAGVLVPGDAASKSDPAH